MTVRVVRHRVSAVGGRVGLPGGQLRRGHSWGRFFVRLSLTPLSCVLMRVPLTRDRAPKPYGTAAIRSQAPEPESPLLGGEWGWKRPPSDRTIYGPGIRTYARTYFRGRGSLPARACGANDPCGKAPNPPARRVEAGRLRGLRWPAGAAHVLVAPLHGVVEPVGLPLRRRRPAPPAGRGRRPQRCAAPPGAHRCGDPGVAIPVRSLPRQRRGTVHSAFSSSHSCGVSTPGAIARSRFSERLRGTRTRFARCRVPSGGFRSRRV